MRDYYEQQLGGDRLVIAVTGDFDAAAMIAKLTAAFGDWRPAAAPLPDVPRAAAQSGRRVLLIDKPGATQTYFWLGNVGVARDYENRAALDIANTVFGGRYTSMLNTELRVKSGLTYGAQSQLSRASRPGSLAIVSYTPTETTFEALDMALGVLGRLHATGVDEEALASARNYILGQFPTALETAAQLGRQLAALAAFGLDVGYINDYGQALMAADTGGGRGRHRCRLSVAGRSRFRAARRCRNDSRAGERVRATHRDVDRGTALQGAVRGGRRRVAARAIQAICRYRIPRKCGRAGRRPCIRR